MTYHNAQLPATPPQRERRHSEAISTKTSEVSSAEPVVDDPQLFPTLRLANDGDVTAMEEGGLKDGKKKMVMMSPRLDAQLGVTRRIVARRSSSISRTPKSCETVE